MRLNWPKLPNLAEKTTLKLFYYILRLCSLLSLVMHFRIYLILTSALSHASGRLCFVIVVFTGQLIYFYSFVHPCCIATVLSKNSAYHDM